jgi:DNA-binding NtrC family response regulator
MYAIKEAHPMNATTAMPTLLLVDDEASMRRSLKRTLDDEPYKIIEAASAQAALEILASEPVHVILSDHNMPGMCGLDLLRMVKLRHSSVVRMMVTANDEFDVAVRAINLGEVSRLIRKPWDDDELCCSVRQAFEQAALEREVKQLRRQARRHLADLAELERRHPGIATINRDSRGAILLDELDDLGRMQCETLWRDEA